MEAAKLPLDAFEPFGQSSDQFLLAFLGGFEARDPAPRPDFADDQPDHRDRQKPTDAFHARTSEERAENR
jgi:hypothetical protein